MQIDASDMDQVLDAMNRMDINELGKFLSALAGSKVYTRRPKGPTNEQKEKLNRMRRARGLAEI